jgi:hypothetical protein
MVPMGGASTRYWARLGDRRRRPHVAALCRRGCGNSESHRFDESEKEMAGLHGWCPLPGNPNALPLRSPPYVFVSIELRSAARCRHRARHAVQPRRRRARRHPHPAGARPLRGESRRVVRRIRLDRSPIAAGAAKSQQSKLSHFLSNCYVPSGQRMDSPSGLSGTSNGDHQCSAR